MSGAVDERPGDAAGERPGGVAAGRALQPALARAHYVDHVAWERERAAVLHGEWFCAGRRHGLGLERPNRRAVIDVAGESILLTTDGAGGLHGHYNVCRHRGAQIVPVDPAQPPPQPCDARSLRCAYHSWTYDLAGALLRAPHTEDVTDFDPGAFGLHPVAVDEWGGFVFVHLEPERAEGLDAALGHVPGALARYPLTSLRPGRRLVYDVAANWKVIAENYNECYHCAGVHPELVRLVPAFGRGGTDLDWDAGVPHRAGAWTFTATGTSDRAPFPDLDADERVRHKGELVYPNLLLSLSADHVAAFTLWPRAVDRTRIVCDLLFAPDEMARDGFDPSDAADFWDTVNRQDWAVCESVQRGMTSRAYRQGWYAPMEDASLDIRRWLLPRLEGRRG
ncbi:MAG TPA: aromatic ring-hydroxylating dioxygenase subunit alpha [Euzebyales bacterium]|nr:aromatic ring-hydroxylating dioxygenase subunit alpha [Euzebyales bacterium]